jgi:predicted dehydrogenase
VKVKVLGAGSIGNHLANASRRLGWSVDMVDTDPAALERTWRQIYPARYGHWDQEIRLFIPEDAPRGGYDLICVGTPPDSHMPVAHDAIAEKPRALLIEKPICGPDLVGAQELLDRATASNIAVFVGYDHVVGQAARFVAHHLEAGSLSGIATIDVEFREHWGGIFAAHPWLAGPWESYLGFSARGGGASGEHSHAANLWQHFAAAAGAGRVVEVDASLDFVRDSRLNYDRLCLMNLRTESGLVGRCVQDVVTHPAKKCARIQGASGFIEWYCGKRPGPDRVRAQFGDQAEIDQDFSKTRPDDFIEELRHIAEALSGAPSMSPITLARGLETMLVISAAHRSSESGRRARIHYDRGFTSAAITLH